MEEKKSHWPARGDLTLICTIVAAILIYGGERSANAETRKIVDSHAEVIQRMSEGLNAANERLARMEAQIAFLVKEAQK